MSVTDEIKARIDIIDLIQQSVPLKKAGRNYKGLCPFHDEKTPSFTVFPDTQRYRCFGCGRGGDIFNFVMEKEGWDFVDALRELAAVAGVELQTQTPQQAEAREVKDRLKALLADAALFFHSQLLDNPNAAGVRDYAEKRGLSFDIIKKFQIGYAPHSWDATANYLMNLGYEWQEIVDAGMLVVREEEDRSYDRFRDRLMIPIRDLRGNVVGFGARALSPDAHPKYLNSPQSAIFDKSKLLFGLSDARRSIRESETAVIVEGYMDVIQAHQAGFENVVAQMGTALAETQLRMLARYASRLTLALDPDAAGQMATDRGRQVIERVSKASAEQVTEEGIWELGGLDTAEREYRAKLTTEFDAHGMLRYESRLGFDIRVAILPEGYDPDDLIRHSPAAWAELIENALPIVEYVIQNMTAGQNLDDPKVKSRVAKEIIPMINDIADPVERSYYRQKLALLLRIDERALFADQPKSTQNQQARSQPAPPPPIEQIIQPEQPTRSLEAFCLAALIHYQGLIYQVNRVLAKALDPATLYQAVSERFEVSEWPVFDSLLSRLVPADFQHPEHRVIFEIWQTAHEQDEVDELDFLYGNLDSTSRQQVDEWVSRPIYAIQRGVAPPAASLSSQQVQDEVIRGVLDLRSKHIKEQFQELTHLMRSMDNGGDGVAATEYGATSLVLMAALARVEKARHRYTASGRRAAAARTGFPRIQ